MGQNNERLWGFCGEKSVVRGSSFGELPGFAQGELLPQAKCWNQVFSTLPANPMRRAHYYRKKAEECRLHAAAAKHAEVEETLQRLAAQWERLVQEVKPASQQAQRPQTKEQP